MQRRARLLTNLDPEVHELLRQRAADAGMTLGEYVLEPIRKDLRKPSRTQWLARVRALEPLGTSHEDTIASIDADRADSER